MKLGKGEMSTANGMDADGCIIRDNEQARKVRAGTSSVWQRFSLVKD